MEKQCKHNYVSAVVIKKETPYSKYVGGDKYISGLLIGERLFIFCTNCGDSKEVTPTEGE